MQDWVEVPLTKGKVAKIDCADMLIIGRFRWSASLSDGHWYARRSDWDGVRPGTLSMHRWILEAPAGMYVDHINGDGLDNRRSNLRLATPSQNNANRRGRVSGVTSQFIGVCKRHRRWHARIRRDGKMTRLGSFASAEDAARAYDAAVVELRGEFALTNFPTAGGGKSLRE